MLAPKKIRVNAIAPGSIEFPGGLWETNKTTNPQLYNAVFKSIRRAAWASLKRLRTRRCFCAATRRRGSPDKP